MPVVPACTIDTVCPATVSVPSRGAPPLAATENVVAPDPAVADAEVSVMKALLLDALHAHPVRVETATEAWPPASAIGRVVAETEYPQVCCCFTVNVWPPILTVPARGLPGFADSVTFTE